VGVDGGAPAVAQTPAQVTTVDRREVHVDVAQPAFPQPRPGLGRVDAPLGQVRRHLARRPERRGQLVDQYDHVVTLAVGVEAVEHHERVDVDPSDRRGRPA
jgi:hypothetical protein